MSKKTKMLLLSGWLEYTCLELLRVFVTLYYIVQLKDPKLGFLFLAISYIGPVCIGPITGVITDFIKTRFLWIPCFAMAFAVLSTTLFNAEWSNFVIGGSIYPVYSGLLKCQFPDGHVKDDIG